MYRFELHLNEDKVAEGILFSDKSVALRWPPTTMVYQTFDDMYHDLLNDVEDAHLVWSDDFRREDE